MSSAKWRPFCLGLNVLKPQYGGQVIAFEWLRILLTHQWPPMMAMLMEAAHWHYIVLVSLLLSL